MNETQFIQIINYISKYQDDPEEYNELLERMAPVLLESPSLLVDAVLNACSVGLTERIWQVCQEHAAEVAAIKARIEADDAADDAK